MFFLQEKELNQFRSSGNRCLLRPLGINLLLFCLMIWINLCQLPVLCKKWVEKLCTSVDLLKVRADNKVLTIYYTLFSPIYIVSIHVSCFCISHLRMICVHLVCYLMHYSFFGLFSYAYALSVTVLTLWMAPPQMFYNISKPKPIVELHRFWASYCGTVATF